MVRPLNKDKDLKQNVTENKIKKIDLSQFEDVEDDDDYSAPCVLSYDEEDEGVESKF